MLDDLARPLPPRRPPGPGAPAQPGRARRAASRTSSPASARRAKPARVVAVTGSGGVGKSTLVGKLIEQIRAAGPDGRRAGLRSAKPAHRRRPARRPLPHAGPARRRRRLHPQPGRRRRPRAPSPSTSTRMIRLLEAFGFDVVLIETVGAGQGDTAVRDLADVRRAAAAAGDRRRPAMGEGRPARSGRRRRRSTRPTCPGRSASRPRCCRPWPFLLGQRLPCCVSAHGLATEWIACGRDRRPSSAARAGRQTRPCCDWRQETLAARLAAGLASGRTDLQQLLALAAQRGIRSAGGGCSTSAAGLVAL